GRTGVHVVAPSNSVSPITSMRVPSGQARIRSSRFRVRRTKTPSPSLFATYLSTARNRVAEAVGCGGEKARGGRVLVGGVLVGGVLVGGVIGTKSDDAVAFAIGCGAAAAGLGWAGAVVGLGAAVVGALRVWAGVGAVAGVGGADA